MSFSFFNSFNGNSQRLGQKYSIVSPDINPPGLISSIGTDTSSVTFSFTAPRTGGTVAGYTAYVNGKPFSGTGGPSSYTINGLAQGGQYTINMVANIVSTSSTSSTTTSTFNPTSISGCAAWWDGSDPYGTGTPPANGTAISTWTDKSGSGYNGIAQSGLTATYSSAGKSLTFNNAYYTTNYPANPTYETCFMVSNYTNTNVEVVPIGSTAGGRIIVYNGVTISLGTGYVGGGSSSTGLATDGTNNLAVTVINTIAASYSSINGALTLNGPTAMGAFTAGKTTFLGRDGNPKIFYGNVCEILMYNTALSATDRQKVEGYLAWKWSMQSKLPSGHPYYSTNGHITSNTVTTTNTKNVLSNPSQPLVISTLATFPTNIQLISATTTSLTFSFTAPTTGPTPTSYIPYINGSVGTGSGTPSSYTITGLSGSTSYSVALASSITTTAVFTPTLITGCSLWLDASDALNNGTQPTNGSTLTQWRDKSGLGNNTTNSYGTTPTFVTNTINGLPVVSAVGGGFLGSFSTNYTGNTFTFYMIISLPAFGYPNGNPRYPRILSAGNNTNGTSDWNSANNFTITSEMGPYLTLTRNLGPSNSIDVPTMSLNTTYLVSGYFDGTNEYFGLNGTYTSTASSGNFDLKIYTLGVDFRSTSSTNTYGLSKYGEVLMYQNLNSTTDRQKVEGYLAWKWGIQSNLPVAHPYYGAAPSGGTTTIYQNPNPVSLTTAIGTPTTLTFISSTATTITFSFTAPSGTVTGYTPYVNGSVGVGSGTASSYTITGLSASTSYSVTISASGPTGTSGQSTALSASTGVPTLNTYLPMNNNLLNYASGTGVSYAATATGVTFSNAVTGPANLGTYFLYNNSLTNYVNLNKTITFPSGGMSISFWVYTPTQNQIGYNNILWFGTGSARYGVFLYCTTTTSGFNVVWAYTGFQVHSTPNYANNQWHHIVWTTASNNINNGYVDGNLILTNSAGSNYPNLVNTNNYFFIENGGASGAKAMSAYLGEFRIYSTVLNQSQVNTLYNNGNGNINPGI